MLPVLRPEASEVGSASTTFCLMPFTAYRLLRGLHFKVEAAFGQEYWAQRTSGWIASSGDVG